MFASSLPNGTVVLGIDPGLTRCGFGAVKVVDGAVTLLAAGLLTTPAAAPLDERLFVLAADLDALLGDLQPSAVAVERVFFQNNVRTAMSVGQASGLALVAARRAGASVALYTPSEVKSSVCGHGGADKAQVQHMVARLLGLAEPPQPPDVADAIALALCHVTASPLAQRHALAGKSA